MSGERNAFTGRDDPSTVGDPLVRKRYETVDVSDPTLGNGDGTFAVALNGLRNIDSTDDAVGTQISGNYEAEVDSVSGNSVTVLIRTPDGSGSLTAASDGELTGETLSVVARG